MSRKYASHSLTSVAEVEAIVGRPAAMIMRKQINALDDGCRTVLGLSPVAAFGWRDADGTSRTTFVGGRPGFARMQSPARFSFALSEPGDPEGPVSLFFLLPGVGELLRVNGTVVARTGAEVTVGVQEAFVHCAQAVLRSGLWRPATPFPPAGGVDDGPLSAPGVADFLAAAPFLALSTWDSDGGSDTSPRGDQQAVARILDGRTLLMPDRRGNKRADTLHNLLRDDRLSFAALAPGRGGVLHVRGRGTITDDPALLATMALRGLPPHAALLIDVEHAEVTGNDAVAGSRMWVAGTHLGRDTAPDLMAIAGQHLAASSAPGRLMGFVGSVPGMTRLMRLVIDRAYRSGLRKEGYQDAGGAGARREVRVVRVRRETPTVVTLVLKGGGAFDFRPGQFFTLIADLDGRPVRRAYSASSAPGSSRLEVTVKLVDGGRFSAHVHNNLRRGARLALRGPSGSFHAAPGDPDDLVLVAAGSGVTPMMSIIRSRLATGPRRGRIALLYSSRSNEEIIFTGDLARLAAEHPDRLSVTHVLTTQDGRVDADGIRRWVTGLSPAESAHYYVCGPAPLMEATEGVLAALGVPGERVHTERYTSEADAGAATTVPRTMTVEERGRPVGTVLVEPGQTLLDAGLAAGLPMPYSCTVGNCGDCLVRLRAGAVTRPRADGLVRTCVEYPASDVTLDLTSSGGTPG